MTDRVLSLAQAEKRRQWTVLLLAAGLIASTLPVANERALFAPFGELDELPLPSAYAVIMRTGFGPRHGGRGRIPRVPGRTEAAPPPAAFAARFPNEPSEPAPATPQSATVQNNGVPPGSGLSAPSRWSPVTTFTGGPGGTQGTTPGTPNPTSPAPEPDTWVMMIVGFGFIGTMLRRARRKAQRERVVPA